MPGSKHVQASLWTSLRHIHKFWWYLLCSQMKKINAPGIYTTQGNNTMFHEKVFWLTLYCKKVFISPPSVDYGRILTAKCRLRQDPCWTRRAGTPLDRHAHACKTCKVLHAWIESQWYQLSSKITYDINFYSRHADFAGMLSHVMTVVSSQPRHGLVWLVSCTLHND